MKESLMIAVFIIIVFVVLQYIGKNIVMKKMTTSLEEEKYDAFFKTSQSILCFLFVKPYIKESMKLSAYIAQEESEEVKKEITQIIEKENKLKPYSDEKIRKLLEEKDIYISRRTVTKYREECFIYNSRQRKIEKILWEEK